MEKNWFYPKESGYYATYFLLSLAGKKYLPWNFSINYKIKFYKKYIIFEYAGNKAYLFYTLDHISHEKYSKSFCLILPTMLTKYYLNH